MWSDGADQPNLHGSFTAAVEAELRESRLDLTFPPFLESRYQQDWAEARSAQLRKLSMIGWAAASLLVILVGLLVSGAAAWMPLLVTCLALAALTAGLRRFFGSTIPQQRREGAAFALGLAFALAVSLSLVWGGERPGVDALALATLGTTFLPLLLLLPVRRAAALSGASLVLYAALLLGLLPLPWNLALLPLACQIILTLLALTALHGLERGARRLYLHEVLQKAQGERSSAFVDPLTGLANRERMDAALAALCDQEEVRASFLMIDIDLFQDFNEQYGHEVGDRLLHDLSRCLAAALRDGDLLARMGGEEFGVLLNGLVMQDAILVAERLRVAVATFPFMVGTKLIRMTVSIGVTGIVPCDEPSRILDSAEKGMHLAKRAGRNQVGGPWLKLPS